MLLGLWLHLPDAIRDMDKARHMAKASDYHREGAVAQRDAAKKLLDIALSGKNMSLTVRDLPKSEWNAQKRGYGNPSEEYRKRHEKEVNVLVFGAVSEVRRGRTDYDSAVAYEDKGDLTRQEIGAAIAKVITEAEVADMGAESIEELYSEDYEATKESHDKLG